ncbi:MAG: cytochrome c oxidase subunit II [Chloroflexaceae bacterium]|nr:cytochrome c oxidase subunit II [Chloroflexaceae bacterium]
MALWRILRSQLLWVGGLGALGSVVWPGVASAQSVPSPLDPASPNAALVANLYWIIFWMSVVVFVLVEGLLIYSAIRFRRRDDNEVPVQVHGNNRMEIAWTIGPALIAAAVFFLSWQVMLADRPPTADGVSAVSVASVCFNNDVSPEEAAQFLAVSTVTIEVVGRQWWWAYNYLDYGFTSAADLYVPVGEVVVLQLTSRDVAHSWWIPQLGGKQDLYPGATTYSWFQVTEPGVYEGHCTELCGSSHAYMPMRVVAVPADQFDTWAQNQAAANEVVERDYSSNELASEGQDLFTSKGCIGCHAVGGLGAGAEVGPDLTNLASRQQIAGMLPYNRENLKSWIIDPSQKPGSKMPRIPLTDAEAEAIVEYLDTQR